MLIVAVIGWELAFTLLDKLVRRLDTAKSVSWELAFTLLDKLGCTVSWPISRLGISIHPS